MDFKTKILGYCRFNSIFSFIFFSAVIYYLTIYSGKYLFDKYTISRSILFLDGNSRYLFQAAFVIKSLIDLSFIFFVFQRLNVKATSKKGMTWLFSIFCFALLGLVTSDFNRPLHITIAAFMVVSWTLGEYAFSRVTNSKIFIRFTKIIILTQIIFPLGILFLVGFNSYFEIAYSLLAILWLSQFIKYLK